MAQNIFINLYINIYKKHGANFYTNKYQEGMKMIQSSKHEPSRHSFLVHEIKEITRGNRKISITNNYHFGIFQTFVR